MVSCAAYSVGGVLNGMWGSLSTMGAPVAEATASTAKLLLARASAAAGPRIGASASARASGDVSAALAVAPLTSLAAVARAGALGAGDTYGLRRKTSGGLSRPASSKRVGDRKSVV